jgi:hypothetical protein
MSLVSGSLEGSAVLSAAGVGAGVRFCGSGDTPALGVEVGVFADGCGFLFVCVLLVDPEGVNINGGLGLTVSSVMKKLTGVLSVEK